MLSEREAWQRAANYFRDPEVRYHGICGLFNRWRWTEGLIDNLTYRTMEDKIDKALGDRIYLAPYSAEGNTIRVSFCERMAAQCDGN